MHQTNKGSSTLVRAVRTHVYDEDARFYQHVDPLGRTTTLLYDGAGRVTGTYDALSHITSTVYDAAGRTLAVADPLGYRSSITYDAAGQPVAHTDPNGFVTTTVYDLAGRAVATVDPLGYRTTTTYDADGNVVALTDQNGHVTTAVYDPRGLVTASQDALGLWSYAQVRYGFRCPHVLLQREGWEANGCPINHKRVCRLYKLDGLEIRTKKAKKRISRARVVVPAATTPNERWSTDFITDRLFDGRRFRVLTIVDHFSHVSPAIEADVSLMGQHVVAVVARLAQAQQVPKEICVDNGPEFISRAMDEWAHRHGMKLTFSHPGTPTDNAYIESFNARLRQECLNENWFLLLADAQAKLECHRKEYNSYRPHSSLGDLTPEEFTVRWRRQLTAEHKDD